jgi:hypothetical protein
MSVPAYPLQWPAGWKRTFPGERTRARFAKKREHVSLFKNADGSFSRRMVNGEITIAQGVERVRAELARMGIQDDDLVISTDLQLRMDGWPKSTQREPDDPGVAVYWQGTGPARCMAIDRYVRIADNLAAVAATLDAMRAIERHGGAQILERAFTGFTAIEHQPSRHWWDVLGISPEAHGTEVHAAYMRLRSKHHPDNGGDTARFQEIMQAYEQATA